MKRLLVITLMAMLVPVGAMAMKDMDHKSDAKAMDHGSMGMEGVVMLQDEVVEGVKGSAHLMDDKKMGQMLMVMFTEEGSGKMLSKGRVAVKVEAPDESVSDPQKMMKSKGMFGAGVKLDQKGVYHFKVGTKLADGKKRTFHFHHEG